MIHLTHHCTQISKTRLSLRKWVIVKMYEVVGLVFIVSLLWVVYRIVGVVVMKVIN